MKKLHIKADEMEMSVNAKATRNAFVFLEPSLAVYCLVSYLKTGEMPRVWLIFLVSHLIFLGTKLIESRRLAASGDSDEE